MNARRFMVTGLLFGAVSISHTTKTHEDVLKPLQDKINKEFVDRCSEIVAKRDHKGKHLSKEFQEFLDNDELALKMTQVYGDGTGEFAVKVINKKDIILKDLINKRHELAKAEKASAQNMTLSKLGGFAGTGLFLIGMFALSQASSNGEKGIGGVLCTTGVSVDIYSWLKYRWSAEEYAQKQIHRTEITKIEEKWDHTFASLQKKHEVHKAADK